jgi:hypothetical protein
MENVILTVISLIGTLGGSFLGVMQANKLSNYRISQLEDKVNKHNNLIDRMYKVETRVTLIEDEMKK